MIGRATLALLLALPAAAGAETAFRLGVQTHFEQGWSLNWVRRAADLGVTLVRDELDWAGIETRPGQYDFAAADLYMQQLAQAGISVLLVEVGANPIYDGGTTVISADGRSALSAYLQAVARHYGDQLAGIEIGNEVNAGESTSGTFDTDPARYLAGMAAAVPGGRLPDQPGYSCAGTNTVALGFLRQFFLAGGLLACDAISVHPYGVPPETVDLHLDRLNALMQELGGEKPIDATEFGQWTDRPEEAPAYLVKMVAVLAESGVGTAIWYALADEPWWPNMGLYSDDGSLKPAGRAYAFVQARLVPLGRPVERSPSRAARILAYGNPVQAIVAWGAGQPVTLGGDMQAFDAMGQPIALPDRLGDAPVILLGRDISVDLAGPPVAESLFQFDQPPFSYFARRPGVGLTPLERRDWQWSSFRGAPDLSPLSITANWVTTARFEGQPFSAVERFTATASGRYQVEGWWQSDGKSDPSLVILSQSGQEIGRGRTDGPALPLAR
ncbi:MAG: hypothetical protein R3D63_09480 [Paracoccaceae bacterium]